MSGLVKSADIFAFPCGDNFAYILDNQTLYSATEYKVLQGQSDGQFVRCMKQLYNGKIALYYLTNGLVALSDMLSAITADKFLAVIGNLFFTINAVIGNGFLTCQNLDVSVEHIFVDTTTLKTSLVYLPCTKKNFPDFYTFENCLRTNLVKLVQKTPSLLSAETSQLVAQLSNGSLSFDELSKWIKSNPYNTPQAASQNLRPGLDAGEQKTCGHMKIIAIDTPVQFELTIDKSEYVLGRKAELSDGVIPFNKMIGRTHCTVLARNEGYAIVDLNSSNGTYVNGVRLKPNQPYPVKDGDIVRLANSEFRVVIS